MNIAVLGGGDSTERAISLRSAAAVADALKKTGFDVIELDPKDGIEILDGLSKDTIVFPILHGQGGEDGKIQSELEKRGLSYLGTKSEASAVCFDKQLTLDALAQAYIPVPKGALVDAELYKTHELAKSPHVLKVARGGSSIGTYIVHDPSRIDEQKVQEVFSLDEKAVLEELVQGIEITVPILDTSALPVIEISLPEDKDFDYENKYNGNAEEICPPQSIDKNTQIKAQRLAEEVHKVLGARHLSRVDMIVKEDGSIMVLELNTMPGMTDQSLYPKSAAVAGMNMPELMKRFVNLVESEQK